MLYALCGYPFAGKTTVADALVKTRGYVKVSTDNIKTTYGYSRDHYVWIPEETWQKILTEAYDAILSLLKKEETVVFDYTNSTKKDRNACRDLAAQAKTTARIIWVTTPLPEVRKRYEENKLIKKRHDIAREFFDQNIGIFEPPTNEENLLTYDGSENIEEWIKKNF